MEKSEMLSPSDDQQLPVGTDCLVQRMDGTWRK